MALDAKQIQAAAFIAAGDLTVSEIAQHEEIGVDERTVYRWKNDPEFQAQVAEFVSEIRQRILTSGIADIVQRVKRYDKRWKQINQIFEERAASTLNIAEPGYGTGLLNRTVTSVTKGDSTYVEEEFKPDIGLLKEERELAKQAAQDLGQWTEKHEHDLSKLSDAELIERAKSLFGRTVTAEDRPD